MGIFISVEKTIECVCIAIAFAAGLYFLCGKMFVALSRFGFKSSKLLLWANSKSNMTYERITLLFMCTALAYAVLCLVFSFAGEYAAICALGAYVIFYIVYPISDRRVDFPCEKVTSARLTRVKAISFLLFAVISYIVVTLLNFADNVYKNAMFSYFRYIFLSLLPLLSVAVVALANGIDKICDGVKDKNLEKMAKAYLESATPDIVLALGHVSIPSVLHDILSYSSSGLCASKADAARHIISSVGCGRICIYADFRFGDVLGISSLLNACKKSYTLICSCDEEKSIENLSESGKLKFALNTSNAHPFLSGNIANGAYKTYPYRGEELKDIKELLCSIFVSKHSLVDDRFVCAVNLCAQFAKDIYDVEPDLKLINFRSDGVFVENGKLKNYILPTEIQIKDALLAVEELLSYGGEKIVITRGLYDMGLWFKEDNKALGAACVGVDKLILIGGTRVSGLKDAFIKAGGSEQNVLIFSKIGDAYDYIADKRITGNVLSIIN